MCLWNERKTGAGVNANDELYKRIVELQTEQSNTSRRLVALESQAQENKEEIRKLRRSIKAGLTQLLRQLFGGEDGE